MVEIAGLTIGAVAARFASARSALLRAAVLAQVADLVTFAFIWRSGDAERNPLGRLAMDVAQGLLGSRGLGYDDRGYLAVILAAMLLFGLKVTLIGFLIRIEPHLGPYRRAVLVLAIAAGILGAISNLLAFPIPPSTSG